jgi:hypothetical protein
MMNGLDNKATLKRFRANLAGKLPLIVIAVEAGRRTERFGAGCFWLDEAMRNRHGSVCLCRQPPCSIAILAQVPISLKLDADACTREPIRMRRVHLLSSASTSRVHYPLLSSPRLVLVRF